MLSRKGGSPPPQALCGLSQPARRHVRLRPEVEADRGEPKPEAAEIASGGGVGAWPPACARPRRVSGEVPRAAAPHSRAKGFLRHGAVLSQSDSCSVALSSIPACLLAPSSTKQLGGGIRVPLAVTP